MPTAAEIAVWQRIIGKSWERLSRETAEGILQLTFSDRDLRRIAALSERASEAGLGTKQQAELENYAFVGRVLGLMHSQARRALAERRPKRTGRRKAK